MQREEIWMMNDGYGVYRRMHTVQKQVDIEQRVKHAGIRS